MAIIRDIMPAFELFQPASIDDALGLLDKYGKEAWVLAGGRSAGPSSSGCSGCHVRAFRRARWRTA